MKLNYTRPDLTVHAPRSARVRLGGYALLARLIDKGRAEVAGTSGDYHYNCPLDQHFFGFAGVDAAALKEQIAAGKGDGELLAWILENRTNKHGSHEIAAWSDYQGYRAPSDNESREYLSSLVKSAGGEAREDITSWADALDLDDFTTFGGKA